jgi:hypothetical protein
LNIFTTYNVSALFAAIPSIRKVETRTTIKNNRIEI